MKCLRVIAVLTILSACADGGPSGPEPEREVVALRLERDAGLLEPGESVQLIAAAYDATGAVVEDVAITWHVDDPAVASVDASGRVTAAAPGSTNVFARSGDLETAAAIGVLAAADEQSPCGVGGPTVALVVEASLATAVEARLARFAQDLCATGLAVRILHSRFPRAGPVRAWLARLYDATAGSLGGAILIGDLPYAYQWITLHTTNPSFPDVSEEAISFQYYADLDGVFTASPDYSSPGGHPHSYDMHTGDVDWEIWVGVLPAAPGGAAATAASVNAHLDRNHAWRNGAAKPPRAFLQVSEHFSASNLDEHIVFMGAMRSGQYAWLPFSAEPAAHLYFDSPPGGLSSEDGYAALEQGVADFTVLDAHGFYGASGQLTIEWARSRPIATNFFWSNGCAVADLDHVDNFLTAVLYGPHSQVLAAKGTTNDSGGLGTNADGFFGRNVATALDTGASLGHAILAHVNVPLIAPWSDSREFHYATAIVLGDPTLGLRD